MIQFGLDTKPPGQVRKRSCSGFKYLFFGRHKCGWRRLETRHPVNNLFLSSQAFHLCFICFWRLPLFPFSSFSVLLVPPPHSTFTSPPPQISLYLSPIFSPVSVASPVLFPLSWCCFRLFFSWSTSSLLHVCPPRLLSSWQMEIVPTVHQNIIQFSSTQTQLDVSRLPVKDISFCRYKLSWKLSTGLVKKHLDLSQQTQLETSQLPVTKIYFYVPNILAGDVLILCQKY